MQRIGPLAGIILLSNVLLAQTNFTDIQGGILMPSGAKDGFIGGIAMGRMVDQNIGYGFEVNYYYKSFTQETQVLQEDQGQVNPVEVTTLIDNSTRLLPVYFRLTYNTAISPKFDLRVVGALGYEFMWNSEENNVTNVDETRFYSGFGWYIGGGFAFPISDAADLMAEAAYHSSYPSRSEGENADGLPVRTEIDMSGLMLRLGIRIYRFGLF
jgi:hypothetical protein